MSHDQTTERWVQIQQSTADCMAAEIKRLREALAQVAAHDTGMRPDFSVGARQAKIARDALNG